MIPRPNHAPGRYFHITVQGGFGDLQRRADVIRIDGLVGEEFICEHNLGVVRSQWGPTTRATPGTSRSKAGFGPLLDESAFELRER